MFRSLQLMTEDENNTGESREGAAVDSVPLVDLAVQHAAVADEVAEGWRQVLAKTSFIAGPQVAAFEAEYAAFTGVRHCVGVANGTDAIEIALRALVSAPATSVSSPLTRSSRPPRPSTGRAPSQCSPTAPMTVRT